MLTYDLTGAYMENSGVVAINQNMATVTFPGPRAGIALVYIQNSYAVESMLVRNELGVGDVELTGSGGALLVNGVAASKEGHAHTFASITAKPTTLAGYGITDAVDSADLAAHVAATDPHPQYTRSLTCKTSSTSSTSLTNVAGGTIALAANTLYRVTMYVRFSSTSSSTGIRLGLTCPSGSTISAIVSIPVRSDSTSGAFQGTIVASGDYVIGTGVENSGVAYIAVIQGVVSTGPTAGDLQLRFGSEVSGSSVSVLPFTIGFADVMQ